MGIFDFLKGSGKKDVNKGNEADDIKQTINAALGDRVDNLNVSFQDGTVKLFGTAHSAAAKEKAVLLAGNLKGVEKVDDDQLRVREEDVVAEPNFYTIEKGDSLSKIAQREYGDAQKWNVLFEANKEVIEDPDLIYPGQRIRIPAEA